MRLWERKLLAKDVVRAVLVLALFCLNFLQHNAVAVAYDADLRPYVLAGDGVAVLCAQDPDGDKGDHTPCHACRVGFDLALPPAPIAAVPVTLAAAAVTYRQESAAPGLGAERRGFNARGPPAA